MPEYLSTLNVILEYACVLGSIYFGVKIFKETRNYKSWRLLIALVCASVCALLLIVSGVFLSTYIDEWSFRFTPVLVSREVDSWRVFGSFAASMAVSLISAYLISEYLFKKRFGRLPLHVTAFFILTPCAVLKIMDILR